MTRCPEDAIFRERYDIECCNIKLIDCEGFSGHKDSEFEYYRCTRVRGHKGKHHYHGLTAGRCYKTWTTEEALVEAL